MEFSKTVLPYLRCVACEVKQQEQTGEIRLPDGAPDVGRVLCTWGQVLIRGKEWNGNGMSVSGGVEVKVLYEPDGIDGLQCVQTWIPFQTKWDFSQTEKDGHMRILPRLQGLDCRTASPRKLIACAHIGISGKAMVRDSLQIASIPELPLDVQILKNSYPIQLPVEAGEKAFAIEETVPILDARPVPQSIISCNVMPVLSETKLMSDKLVFRGAIKLHVVYMDTDSRLYSWHHEIPFSQYTQLDGEYDDHAEVSMIPAVTSLEFERSEDGAYVCKVGLAAQYIVYRRTITEIIEDVFSPIRKLSCTAENMTLPSVLDRREMTVDTDCQIPSEGCMAVNADFYPSMPGTYSEDGEVYADLAGNFRVLVSDGAGNFTSVNGKWVKAVPLQTDIHTRTEIEYLSNGEPEVRSDGDVIRVNARLPLEILTMNREPISAITGIELGEIAEQNPERPSVIIRKIGNDSLWKIAKDTGSSVEAIQNANNIDGEMRPDQLILIPVT